MQMIGSLNAVRNLYVVVDLHDFFCLQRERVLLGWHWADCPPGRFTMSHWLCRRAVGIFHWLIRMLSCLGAAAAAFSPSFGKRNSILICLIQWKKVPSCRRNMLHRSQERPWHRGRNKEASPNIHHRCRASELGQSRAICQLQAEHPRNQKRSWEGIHACKLLSRPQNDPKPRLCCFQSLLLWHQVQSLKLRSWQSWTSDGGIFAHRLLSSAPWGKHQPSGKSISCPRHPLSFAHSRSPSEGTSFIFLSPVFRTWRAVLPCH